MKRFNQRRYLINLCIFSFILWLVNSFGLIAFWYATGGISPPKANPLSPGEYHALLALADARTDWLNDTIFHIIPGLGAGYLLIALMVLHFITKTKPTNENENVDSPPC